MAKEEISKEVKEIKKAIESESVRFGTNLTLKDIKLNRTKKVFISKNCAQEVRDEIASLKNKSDFEVINLDYPNDELGIICRKPFSISVLSITKDK